MSNLSPCRRCGKCCEKYPCAASWILFDPLWPDDQEDLDSPVHTCPALVHSEDGTAICGMVVHPRDFVDMSERMSSLVRFLMHEHLAIGEGCGAQPPSGERLIRNMWDHFSEISGDFDV